MGWGGSRPWEAPSDVWDQPGKCSHGKMPPVSTEGRGPSEEGPGPGILREAQASLEQQPHGPSRSWPLSLGAPLPKRRHLVNEGQVPLDGGFVVFPLLPQLPAQLLLSLLDAPHSQVPLLHLRGARGGGVRPGSTHQEEGPGARPSQGAGWRAGP